MSSRELHPCLRCGRDTSADFCRDCRSSDPLFCAGGKTTEERRAILAAQVAKEREFFSAVSKIAKHRVQGERSG